MADVTAMAVKQWLDTLLFCAASKARTRNMVSKLLDLAMLWEYIPVGRNPMELVRVKGSTKRLKAITIITPDEFKTMVALPSRPHNLMVLVCGCLGLRVSETLGLKWQDFDFDAYTLSIGQVFTHGQSTERSQDRCVRQRDPRTPQDCAMILQRMEGQTEA